MTLYRNTHIDTLVHIVAVINRAAPPSFRATRRKHTWSSEP